MKKRLFAVLLALVMVLSLLPATALAALNTVTLSVELHTFAADGTELPGAAGGTVTLSKTVVPVSGDEVTLTANLNPGYRLERIIYSGTIIWDATWGPENVVTFRTTSSSEADHRLEVWFAAGEADTSERYDLYIDGIRVCGSNCGDVLGDGVFSYDPARNVLTVDGSYTAEHLDYYCENIIDNDIPDLTVSAAENGAVLSCPNYKNFRLISSRQNLRITGPGEFDLIGNGYYGIAVKMNGDAKLTVENANIMVQGLCYGFFGEYSENTSLEVISSRCVMNLWNYAVTGFKGGITFTDTDVSNPQNWQVVDGEIRDADTNETVSSAELLPNYKLWINGSRVTWYNYTDVLGGGIFSFDPMTSTLTLKGAYESEVYDVSLIDSQRPSLTICTAAEGAELSFTNQEDGYQIITCDGDLTFTGPGKLKLSGSGYEGNAGIYMYRGDLCFDNAQVECTGVDVCLVGNEQYNTALTVDHSVLDLEALTATSNYGGAVRGFTGGVTVTDCTVTEPSGAVIQNGGIFASDGTTRAQTFKTDVPGYNLYIADVQVNEVNCGDVLGNGVFSYDPDENVLYVHGDFAWDVGQSAKNPKAMVYSQIPDLTVNVTEDSLLTNASGNAAAERIFYFARSTTMTGKGFLTLYSPGVTYGIGIGMIRGSSGTHYTLTLDNARLTFLEGSTGIEGATMAYTGLVIRDSVLRFSGQGTIAVSNFRDGVTLDGCAVTSPSGAYFTSEGRLVDSDGTTFVKDAVIRSNDAGSDIYVKDVAVTDDNCDDVLGDGMFSFDPSTDTLFIHGGSLDIGGSRYGIQSYLQGLWIVLEDDVELTDRWGLSEAYIETATDLTITGPHTLKLGGLGAQNGILIDGYGWLRLYNTALQAENVEYGVCGGTSNHASLHLDHSLLTLDTGAKAVSGFNSGITMSRERCFVQGAPVSVLNGDIVGQDGTAPAAMIMQPYFTARMYASSTATTPVMENVYYGDTVSFRDFEHNGMTVADWYTDRALTQRFDPDTVSGLESPDVDLFPSWGYPVWIGETQVTEDNCNDVLGDGAVSFDPASNCLTVNGDLSCGVHSFTDEDFGDEELSAMIYSEGINLRIDFGEVTVRSEVLDAAAVYVKGGSLDLYAEDLNLTTRGTGFYCSGNLQTYGVFNITATHRYNEATGRDHAAVMAVGNVQLNGIMSIVCGACYGVRSIQGNIDANSVLTIRYPEERDADVFYDGLFAGIGSINLNPGAYVTIHAPYNAITANNELNINCDFLDLQRSGSWTLIKAFQGINVASDCRLILPEGGSIQQPNANSYYTVLDADGNEPEQIRYVRSYPLWIGQTQVTPANCGDILEDGCFSFNPITDVLTVYGVLDEDEIGLYANKYLAFAKGFDLTVEAPDGLGLLAGTHSGIRVSDGDLTINGNVGFLEDGTELVSGEGNLLEVVGELTVNGSVFTPSDESCQIWARDGVHITGNADLGGTPAVAAICSDGDVTVDGDVTIYVTTGSGLLSQGGRVKAGGNVTIQATNGFGIWAGDTVAVGEGRWTVESRYGAIVGLRGVGLSNYARITLPAGGVVTTVPLDGDYWTTVVAPGGSEAAKHVIISEGLRLWVGSVQVCESNCADILGDGTVSFDPDTGVLTLNGPLSADNCGTFNVANYYHYALIYAEDMDLTLTDPSGTVRLFNTVDPELREYGVYVQNGSVTVDGDLYGRCGDSTIYAIYSDIRVNGDVDVVSTNYHGNHSDWGPAPLYSTGLISVNGDLTAKANEHSCVYGTEGVFLHGDVNLENTCPAGGRGIYASDIEVDGSLTGVCTNTVIRAWNALHIAGDVDVTTTMEAGNWQIGKFGSYNLHNDGTAIICKNGELDGNVTVNAAGNIGVFSENYLNLGLGRIDVTATEAAFMVRNVVNIDDEDIALPAGGAVNTITVPYHDESTNFLTVTASDGTTPATHVILDRNTLPLWVCGARVTLDNKDDILGDGKVSFDPDTNTLTLDDRILTDGSWTDGEGYAVYADGMDLTVTDTTGTVRLSPADPSASAKGIRCSGTLRVGCSLSAAEGVYAYVEAGNIYVSDDVTNCALFCENGDITIYDNYTMDNPDGAVSIADLNARNITIWGDLMIETGGEMGAYAVRYDGDSDYGTFTAHGDVYIRCTRETGNMGWGILAAQNITIDGSVDAECTAACLYSAFGDVKVSGDVSAVGTTEGPEPAGKYLFPFANGTPIIAPRGSVILSRGATVTAVACVGIFAGDKVYLDGIRSDVTASECAILAKEGIVGAPSAEIILPVNGTIGTVTINGTTYRAVTESDGTTEATHAVIEDSIFPLWVSGVRVTKQNCADIFGDGSAYFDVGTRTLTLSGAQITGSYSWSETDEWGYTANYNAAIYAGRTLGDLRIVASNGLNINNPDGMGIWVRGGNLDIQSTANGGVNVNAVAKGGVIWASGRVNIFGSANLTGTEGQGLGSGDAILVTGDLTVQGNGSTGVYAGSLEVQGDLTVQGNGGTYSTGVFCNQGGVTVGGNAVVTASYDGIEAYGDVSIGGDATVTGTNDCGVMSYKTIHITGGTWDITGGVSALGAFDGIELDENHVIELPVGGVIGMAPMSFPDGKYTRQVYAVTESDGTTAATHAIIAGVQYYDLWVAGVQVTSSNKDDVLNDGGTAVFDPATSTLTLANLSTNQVYQNSVIYSDSMNLTVVPASGSATLTNTGTSVLGFGIQIMNGTLAIDGDLTVSANARCLQATSITCTGDLTLTSSRTSGVSLAQASSGDIGIGGDLRVSGPHGAGITANNVAVGGDVEINLTYSGGSATAISATYDFTADGNVVIYTTGNTINCSNGAVHINGSANLVSTGDVAGTYSLTAKNGIYVGDDLTASAKTNANAGAAVIFTSNGDVTVRGSVNVQNSCETGGMAVNAPYGKVEIMGIATCSSYGPCIHAGGEVKIYYGADVESTGAVGIWAGSKAIVMDGTWDVTGSACAIAAVEGIEITGAHVIDLPVNGELADLSCQVLAGENPVTAWTVAEPGGTTPAAHAIIRQRLQTGFYLIGPDGWTLADIDEDDLFVQNPNAQGEYMLQTTLTEGDPIKVVAVQGGFVAGWFPDGLDNEYVVDAAHAGNVTIYFRTEYQSAWSQFGGYIWIEANDEPQPQYNGSLKLFYSFSLGAEITPVYTITASSVNSYVDYYVVVEKPGAAPVTIHKEDMAAYGTTAFRASYTGIAAKEMGVEFTATLYAKDQSGNIFYGPSVTKTIKNELVTRLGNTSNPAVTRTLCADMLNYGAAAQVYFGYDVENLVNANVPCIHDCETTADPEISQTSATSGEGGNIFSSPSLSSRVVLQITAQMPNGSDVKLKVMDEEGNVLDTLDTTAVSANLFKVNFDRVGAKNMRTLYKFRFVDEGGVSPDSKTLTWSVESYVGRLMSANAAGTPTYELARALLIYGDSAYAYLGD